MIPFGQAYRPSRRIVAAPTVLTLIGGLGLAVLTAAGAWAWQVIPLPTFLILIGVLQGLALGWCLRKLVRAAQLRNPAVALVIGALCGVVSIGLVYAGEYLWFAYKHMPVIIKREEAASIYSPEQIKTIESLSNQPIALTDWWLTERQHVGHNGVIGFVLLKNQVGIRLGSGEGPGSVARGQFLWVMWGVEAAFIVIVAAALARFQALEPFCEDCRRWFGDTKRVFSAPHANLDALADAVSSGSPAKLAAIRQSIPATFEPSMGAAVVDIQQCPKCSQTLADVVNHILRPKGGYINQPKVELISVSPQMVEALKTAGNPRQQPGPAASM
jgi:hypothetical protein